jgi:hypothetical protein
MSHTVVAVRPDQQLQERGGSTPGKYVILSPDRVDLRGGRSGGSDQAWLMSRADRSAAPLHVHRVAVASALTGLVELD